MAEKTKRFYPAFLDLEGRHVIVVGSGRAAERKARQMSRYGASVVLVAPDPSVDILQAQVEGLLDIEDRDYVRGDLEGAALVFCYAPDSETRRAVAAEARAVKAPLNVAGDLGLSTFLVPGAFHREPLQIAVSTGGVSLHAAKHARRVLAEQFGEEWGPYARLLAQVRAVAAERLSDASAVDAVLDAAIASDLLQRVKEGAAPDAEKVFAEFAPPDPDVEEGSDEGPVADDVLIDPSAPEEAS
jgi:siroheme synthase-like protein